MKFRYRDYPRSIVYGLLLCLIAATSGSWWAYLYVLAVWELMLWIWKRDLDHGVR